MLLSFVKLNQLFDTGKRVTTWATIAGSFTTRKVALLHFKMPELSTSKEVKWPCHVDEHTDRKSTPYDLILGVDLLTKLKMVESLAVLHRLKVFCILIRLTIHTGFQAQFLPLATVILVTLNQLCFIKAVMT